MNRLPKQRIWLNITTLAHWNRPAVGIVRVESECAKYLLGQHEIEAHFFVYNKATQQYREIPAAQVRKLLSPATSKQRQIIKAHPTTLSSAKNRIKQVLFGVNMLPKVLNDLYWVTLTLLRRQYRKYFLIPRYYARQRLHNWQLKHGLKQQLSHAHPELTDSMAEFLPGDHLLSMGLDWDYLDLPDLYRLKKEKQLQVGFVCYDIIPVLFPHLCVFDVANQFGRYFVDVAWAADHIFCISQNTQADLTHFLVKAGAPVPTTSVIRLGDNVPQEEVKRSELSPVVQNLIQDEHYVLFVSTIERRKNHETIYRAIRRLVEQGEKNLPQFVFVGMPGWGVNDFLQDLAKDPLIQGKITLLHNVDDQELNVLLKHCLFTVFPSLYEGWGLPVAESLAFGKFCLASNTSSLPEVGGDLVEYIDPWDVPTWAQRLQYYCQHPEAVTFKEQQIKAQYESRLWPSVGQTLVEQMLSHKSH